MRVDLVGGHHVLMPLPLHVQAGEESRAGRGLITHHNIIISKSSMYMYSLKIDRHSVSCYLTLKFFASTHRQAVCNNYLFETLILNMLLVIKYQTRPTVVLWYL